MNAEPVYLLVSVSARNPLLHVRKDGIVPFDLELDAARSKSHPYPSLSASYKQVLVRTVTVSGALAIRKPNAPREWADNERAAGMVRRWK